MAGKEDCSFDLATSVPGTVLCFGADGSRWGRTAEGLSDSTARAPGSCNGLLLVSTGAGVFANSGRGRSWVDFDEGLTASDPYILRGMPAGPIFVAGSDGICKRTCQLEPGEIPWD